MGTVSVLQLLLSLLIVLSGMTMLAEASFGSGEEGDDCKGGNNNIGKLHAGALETVVSSRIWRRNKCGSGVKGLGMFPC
jgi:hypothetical protein